VRRLRFRGAVSTGVPHSSETAPPKDPTVGLPLGPYGGLRGGAVSFERGTPVLEMKGTHRLRGLVGLVPGA